MTTATNKFLKQRIQSRRTGNVLVPILEELLELPEREWRVEDAEDRRYMDYLFQARAQAREKGVFSPSMLGSCQRQAYLAQQQTEKREVPNPRRNGFFIEGDFRHFKWQFLVWKAHRQGMLTLPSVPREGALDFYGDGTGPAVEVRVHSPLGDYAGTIDAIVIIDRPYLVDFKGINLAEFQKTVRYGISEGYGVQMVGYAMILNSSDGLPVPIKDCLLISESKPGPIDGGSPIALHECRVKVDDMKAVVRSKVNDLRGFVERLEMPPISCTSTRLLGFQECPYSYICKDEVKVVQLKRDQEARSKPIVVPRARR